MHPKTIWTGLICRTYQHYHRQWLPNTEWSDFRRWAVARHRWLWRERLREKEGLKAMVENATRIVNNWSRIIGLIMEKSWVICESLRYGIFCQSITVIFLRWDVRSWRQWNCRLMCMIQMPCWHLLSCIPLCSQQEQMVDGSPES